jgi:hypothetical protein
VFFDDVNVEGRVRLLAEGFEICEDAVLGARPESSLQQTLESGKAVRVVRQTEVAEICVINFLRYFIFDTFGKVRGKKPDCNFSSQ